MRELTWTKCEQARGYVGTRSSQLHSSSLNCLLSIYAMNGKSVEIDNTDAEGRLILSGETPPFWCLLLVEP